MRIIVFKMTNTLMLSNSRGFNYISIGKYFLKDVKDEEYAIINVMVNEQNKTKPNGGIVSFQSKVRSQNLQIHSRSLCEIWSCIV